MNSFLMRWLGKQKWSHPSGYAKKVDVCKVIWGWPEYSFGCSCDVLRKIQTNLFGQPKTKWHCFERSWMIMRQIHVFLTRAGLFRGHGRSGWSGGVAGSTSKTQQLDRKRRRLLAFGEWKAYAGCYGLDTFRFYCKKEAHFFSFQILNISSASPLSPSVSYSAE